MVEWMEDLAMMEKDGCRLVNEMFTDQLCSVQYRIFLCGNYFHLYKTKIVKEITLEMIQTALSLWKMSEWVGVLSRALPTRSCVPMLTLSRPARDFRPVFSRHFPRDRPTVARRHSDLSSPHLWPPCFTRRIRSQFVAITVASKSLNMSLNAVLSCEQH